MCFSLNPMKAVWLFVGLCFFGGPAAWADDAPFGGTVYVETDILTADDPSLFRTLSFNEVVEMEHYDERVETERWADFYRFTASFDGGSLLTVDVSDEFGGVQAASDVAVIYVFIIGQLPAVLRTGIEELIIYKTGGDWYASTGEVTIHHGEYALEFADGALEESMIHEGVHASIDDEHALSRGWRWAQQKDGRYISGYAASSPENEDLAETFTLYYGLVMKPDRISDEDVAVIEETIPHRLAYLQENFPVEALGL